MRAMLREKRSISTAGGLETGRAAVDGGRAAATCAAAACGASAGSGAAGAGAVVFSSMRFLPERFVLGILALVFVILFGITLFEAIPTDTDVVVHCSVNLTGS